MHRLDSLPVRQELSSSQGADALHSSIDTLFPFLLSTSSMLPCHCLSTTRTHQLMSSLFMMLLLVCPAVPDTVCAPAASSSNTVAPTTSTVTWCPDQNGRHRCTNNCKHHYMAPVNSRSTVLHYYTACRTSAPTSPSGATSTILAAWLHPLLPSL